MKFILIFFIIIQTIYTKEARTLAISRSQNTTRAEQRITNTITSTIRVKSIKYRCKFTLVHSCEIINPKKITVKCLPTKPKKQVANNVRLSVDGFTYQLNLNINPTSVPRIKFVKKAPECIPDSTTTTSTSTTSTTTNQAQGETTTITTDTTTTTTTITTTTTNTGADSATTDETAAPTTTIGTTNGAVTTEFILTTDASSTTDATTESGGTGTSSEYPTPPGGYSVNTTVDQMNCNCNCNCPANGGECGCGCLCPFQPAEPSAGSTCSLGYTRVCPRNGIQCPEDMLHLCPADMLNELETEQPEVESRKWQTLIVTKNIGVKGVKFRCKITVVHTYFDVNIRASDIRCSPSQPKRQKVNNFQMIGNGYRFELDLSINPSKIDSAKIVTAPKTTTPRTTSTTTTLFSYTGCDCIADFVLYFSKKAMQDRSGLMGQQANFSASWSPGFVTNTDIEDKGQFSQEFIIPRKLSQVPAVKSRQDDLFFSACYCVQENKMENFGAVLEEMNELTGFGGK